MPIFGNGSKRKERKDRRLKKKSSNSISSVGNSSVFSGSNDGVKGSCEDGNLTACKTKVFKANSFNPNKSSGRLNTVGSAKKRKRQELKASTGKTAAGRTIAKVANVFKKNNTDYGNPRFL